jgi:hypothetical protein
VDVRIGTNLAVRASGTAGLGASPQSLVNDGLDGTRAAATFSAATEAAIELLGIAGKVFRGTDGTADIVVAEDVAGADDHENGGSSVMLSSSIFKSGTGCKRKNRIFK